ncbi:hypothetical protein M2189_004848 [Bradyrhizobium japonicum]|uniref:hypothetical protein n=1 Tax=Bradyrhizobium japonicum TaxID=375 RepID=UPI0021679CA1|nr:hypothetical protein [Bradyrhizobium japonicum]MCS3496192.1 hypothetical protein [Bradyrhizobium japonicum]MCS3961645.1 hypothetical protein [Bradyrhizobium japonicum]MCS3993961.1 hypothetical protein [Bradyrhizobium japonicum]
MNDFPIRNITSVSDLLGLLHDYAKGCDAELSDISLTSSWALIAGLVIGLEDHNAGNRTAARNAFFTGLAARIRAVRATQAQCDAFMQREWAKQDKAARRAVNMAKENARLKTRIAELEAEQQRQAGYGMLRAVNE